MRTVVSRCGAILASALAFALYARVHLPWALLGWVALVPWLAALDRERSLRSVFASGVAMSVAFTLAVFAWFASAIAEYVDIPSPVAFGLLALAAPVLQPQIVVFALVRYVLVARGAARGPAAFGGACAWVATEWLWPSLFGDTLGHGLFPFSRLRQGADLTGAVGLTFVILLVNEWVNEAVHLVGRESGRAWRPLAAATGLIAALAMYGEVRLRQTTTEMPQREPLRAALVQAGIGDYDGLRQRIGTYEAVRRILDAYETLSLRALGGEGNGRDVDLLVWPETAYPTTFGSPKSVDGAVFDESIRRFAADAGVALFFGTYDREDEVEFNAAVLLHPQRDSGFDVYRKRRPFPLTEQVPAWLDFSFLRSRLPWLGTWRAGGDSEPMVLRREHGDVLRIAPLICLDAVAPTLALDAARAGADLIVTISNDGWFVNTRGARLHLVVSAFRSIETRLPQLRATNDGISAVVAPTGEIRAQSPVEQPAVLVASVMPGRHGSSPLLRWGHWSGPTALLALAVVLAVHRRRRR